MQKIFKNVLTLALALVIGLGSLPVCIISVIGICRLLGNDSPYGNGVMYGFFLWVGGWAAYSFFYPGWKRRHDLKPKERRGFDLLPRRAEKSDE